MNGFDSSTILWLFIGAQIVGVFTAWLARLSENSPRQTVIQWLFFGILSLMGVITMLAMTVGPGCWIACSTTFAVMVLTVTCDFRHGHESSF